MPDVLQDLPIQAPIERVFDVVSTPHGLNQWWTETCEGVPAVGNEFALGFGDGYQWRAIVTECEPLRVFALRITQADADWSGTQVRFELSAKNGYTQLRFTHAGWPDANAHYRTSCHCWALYLRVARRFVETGETVAYGDRLDA